MDVTRFTHPIDLHAVSITDPFWQRETELVRREVIPYQWDALNDRIPGAEKSLPSVVPAAAHYVKYRSLSQAGATR